ncbi:MAG: tRNA lysidine(34) synthetase TilS [Bacteroidetes bacterium]|nr:tRNA lysidine(34) synthetase TilS [Bacteroidota bacterium]
MLSSQFVDFVKSEKIFRKNDSVLIAVSGGVDSVVLCNLLWENNFKFCIAHCNFKLRGTESDNDALFVKTLSEKFKVPFYYIEFETEEYALNNKISIQLAARQLRYKWFDEILENPVNGINKIVTAHHADDNIETILMNLAKGTGIAGLRGMLPAGKISRPLLFAAKNDLLDYANSNNISWREDSSNSSDKYSRNFFRHNITPLFEKVYPSFTKNMIANAKRMRDTELIFFKSIERIKRRLLFYQNSEIHIPVEGLKKIEGYETILFEIIKDFGFTAPSLPAVVKLLDSESGRYIQSVSHRILKNRNWLIINELSENNDNNILLESVPCLVKFSGKNLKISSIERSADFELSSDSEFINADNLVYPLILRKWKNGDYFYPLGMPKKKKVSKFLTDLKLSLLDKENTWVLESDKKIIWVVGLRIDDRFKIKTTNKSILRLTLSPEK